MISGLGKDGQFVNVIPSQNMVWIRMGEDPSGVPVPNLLNNEIWGYINEFECNLNTQILTEINVTLYPNPVKGMLHLSSQNDLSAASYKLYTSLGQLAQKGTFKNDASLNVENLPLGLYFLELSTEKGMQTLRFVK